MSAPGRLADDGGPTSRRERLTDEALRDLFSGLARPALSPGFHRELRLRLAREQALRRSSRRWARALRLYWLAAITAGLAILVQVQPAGQWQELSVAARLVLLGGCLLPAAVLLWVTRTDPLELAVSGLEWLARASGRPSSRPGQRRAA